MRARRSRLSDEQTRRLLEHFVAGTPARLAAELVHVNRNTATLFYHKMRLLIAEHLSNESPLPDVAAPEGREGEVAPPAAATDPQAKVPVFALVRRGDKVLTVMLPREEPRAPSRDPLRPHSIIYAEAADGPLDVGHLQHERVQRRAHLARGRAPISSVENFWGQAKRQLRRYNGVPRQHFYLFLKECEWRYNYGSPKQLLQLLKSWLRSQSVKR